MIRTHHDQDANAPRTVGICACKEALLRVMPTVVPLVHTLTRLHTCTLNVFTLSGISGDSGSACRRSLSFFQCMSCNPSRYCYEHRRLQARPAFVSHLIKLLSIPRAKSAIPPALCVACMPKPTTLRLHRTMPCLGKHVM